MLINEHTKIGWLVKALVPPTRLRVILSKIILIPRFAFSPVELPGPPTNLAISNIGPRSVTLQFKPGYDGKTSISRWQVEAQVSN